MCVFNTNLKISCSQVTEQVRFRPTQQQQQPMLKGHEAIPKSSTIFTNAMKFVILI